MIDLSTGPLRGRDFDPRTPIWVVFYRDEGRWREVHPTGQERFLKRTEAEAFFRMLRDVAGSVGIPIDDLVLVKCGPDLVPGRPDREEPR